MLVTDLTMLDDSGDHAVLIEHPPAATVAAAMTDAGQWRATIGAFQLGVPVSTKADMLLYHMRLLSVMRWRTAQLSRNSRWYRTMVYYLGLLSEKVQALGGNPWTVPATPDGAIPQLEEGFGGDGTVGGDGSSEFVNAIETLLRLLRNPFGCGLLLIILLLLLLLVWL